MVSGDASFANVSMPSVPLGWIVSGDVGSAPLGEALGLTEILGETDGLELGDSDGLKDGD